MIKITIKKLFLVLILFSFSIFNLQSLSRLGIESYKQEETINASTEKPEYVVQDGFEEISYNNGVFVIREKRSAFYGFLLFVNNNEENERKFYREYPLI
jgi:hypothetical protein